jgi:hypothetical protein
LINNVSTIGGYNLRINTTAKIADVIRIVGLSMGIVINSTAPVTVSDDFWTRDVAFLELQGNTAYTHTTGLLSITNVTISGNITFANVCNVSAGSDLLVTGTGVLNIPSLLINNGRIQINSSASVTVESIYPLSAGIIIDNRTNHPLETYARDGIIDISYADFQLLTPAEKAGKHFSVHGDPMDSLGGGVGSAFVPDVMNGAVVKATVNSSDTLSFTTDEAGFWYGYAVINHPTDADWSILRADFGNIQQLFNVGRRDMTGSVGVMIPLYSLDKNVPIKIYVTNKSAGAVVTNLNICFIPPVSVVAPTFNTMRLTPEKWVVGQEYDFGDGVFGIRTTGTITQAPLTRANILMLAAGSGVKSILQYGGWMQQAAWDLNRVAAGTQVAQNTAADINDIVSSSSFQTGTAGYLQFTSISVNDRVAIPFDVWCLYSKV